MLDLPTITTLLITLTATTTTALSIPSFSSLTSRAVACTPPTTHTPPSGKPRFQLLTIATSNTGNLSLAGTWVSSAHNGAGSAAPLLVTNQSLATTWKYNTARGDIFYNTHQVVANKTEAIPWSLVPYSSDTSTGIMAVEIAIGEGKSNFTFDPVRNVVSPPCGTFAACWLANDGVYAQSGNVLVWHQGGANQEVDCVDVELKAVDTF